MNGTIRKPTLTAADVGALRADGTAADADKLGGKTLSGWNVPRRSKPPARYGTIDNM